MGVPPAIPSIGKPPGLAPPAPSAANRGRSNSDTGGASGGSSDAGGIPSAPQLGGILAGGIPKLRKTGGGVATGGMFP